MPEREVVPRLTCSELVGSRRSDSVTGAADLLRVTLLQFQETQPLQRPRMVGVERQRALDRLFGFIDAALRRQHQASHVVGAGVVGLQRQGSFDRLRGQRDLVVRFLARAVQHFGDVAERQARERRGGIGIDLQRLLEQGASPLRLFTCIYPLEDTQALQRRVDAGEAAAGIRLVEGRWIRRSELSVDWRCAP